MPVQSLRKFDRRERRSSVVRRPVGALALARLVIFGGAAALTLYGAREMYGVVARRRDHHAQMGAGRAVRRQLRLDRVRFHLERLRLRLAAACAKPLGPLPQRLESKTAVVMPIYNEAPARVFAALQAICEDVRATGLGDAFDYFFLSDTTDPDIWIAEERALLAMRERLPGERDLLPPPPQEHRAARPATSPISSRAGARAYEHMLVLDADSLMSGRRHRPPRRGDGGRP